MIKQLITVLKSKMEAAANADGRLSMIKTVHYGPAQAIPTTSQPALLFNFLGSDSVYGQSKGRVLEMRFGLYACNSVTSSVEQAAIDAQNLYWFYSDSAPFDRGLIPWIMNLCRSNFFYDSLGRQWRVKFDDKKPVKIYADLAGQNVRGAVYTEIVLMTMLDNIN